MGSQEPNNPNFVKMAIWNGEIKDKIDEIVNRYNLLDKNNFVRVELQTGQQYETWMQIQFVGGKPPAIMQSQWLDSWDYGNRGYIRALDEYLERPNPYTGITWKKQYLEREYEINGKKEFRSRLDSVRAPDGKIYVIPLDQVKTGIFYNKGMFRKYRIEIPKTWAEMLKISAELKKQGLIPIGVPNVGISYNPINWVVDTFFDSIYRDVIPQMDVLSVNGFVDREELMRAYYKGVIDPESPKFCEMWRVIKEWSQFWEGDFNTVGGDVVSAYFLRQRSAMIIAGCWEVKNLNLDIADLLPHERFEFGVFPLPHVTEETSSYFHQPLGSVGTVGMSYVIPTDIPYQRVTKAIDWLHYLTIPQNVTYMSENLNLPCIKDVPLQEGMDGFLPLMDGTYPDLKISEHILSDERAYDEWFRAFQAFLVDRMTMEQFAKTTNKVLKAGVDRVIKSYNYDISTW